jgi:hypothetical protein
MHYIFSGGNFYIMLDDEFRKPLGQDPNGLYITKAQLQFFLNRPKGAKEFIERTSNFLSYFYKCAVYNIIWDLMDKDPACAKIYWDPKQEKVAISFPLNGKVVQEFKDKNVEYLLQ